ncbi:MAG TPA: hypothetical protein VKY74_26965 [Chloroflexia bacterium]|nr:hypothetical protein [Chloroflexia bacterium]
MANATLLHIGTRQGLVVASKPGTSPEWHITRRTLDDQAITAVVLGAALPLRLLAAVPAVGLFHSGNNGRDWLLSLPRDVALLVADPRQPDRIYAALGPATDAVAADDTGPAGPIMGTVDGGLSWQPLAPLPAAAARVLSLALTAEGDGRIWVGLDAGGILYSADGTRWQGLGLGLAPAIPVRALVAAGPDPSDLFAATPAGIYRLAAGQRADDGAWKGTSLAWRLVGADTPPDIVQLLPIGRPPAPAAAAPAILAVDQDGGLWRGAGVGQEWSWQALWPAGAQAAGPVQATALAGHPHYPDRAYAATRAGRIYETRDRGTSWEDIHLAPGEVLSLAVQVIK